MHEPFGVEQPESPMIQTEVYKSLVAKLEDNLGDKKCNPTNNLNNNFAWSVAKGALDHEFDLFFLQLVAASRRSSAGRQPRPCGHSPRVGRPLLLIPRPC